MVCLGICFVARDCDLFHGFFHGLFNWFYRQYATDKSKTVAVLSGRTFFGAIKVAILPIERKFN